MEKEVHEIIVFSKITMILYTHVIFSNKALL